MLRVRHGHGGAWGKGPRTLPARAWLSPGLGLELLDACRRWREKGAQYRDEAALEAARRAEANQLTHEQSEIEAAGANQQSLQKVRVATQVHATHPAGTGNTTPAAADRRRRRIAGTELRRSRRNRADRQSDHSYVERVRGTPRQILGRHPHRRLFRLPLSFAHHRATVEYARSIVSIPDSTLGAQSRQKEVT